MTCLITALVLVTTNLSSRKRKKKKKREIALSLHTQKNLEEHCDRCLFSSLILGTKIQSVTSVIFTCCCVINAGINKWREKALWKVGKTTSRRFWELEQLAEKRRSKRGLTSLWIFLWHFHLRSWQCCQLTHFLLFLRYLRRSRVAEEEAVTSDVFRRSIFYSNSTFSRDRLSRKSPITTEAAAQRRLKNVIWPR